MILLQLGQDMRKCVLCDMRTSKVQISLRIRAVWSAPLFSLFRLYDMYTCYIQKFKIPTSFCSLAVWFKSYLVENPWRHVFVWCGSVIMILHGLHCVTFGQQWGNMEGRNKCIRLGITVLKFGVVNCFMVRGENCALQKKLIEKSRECHNHKPQPTQRKRKMTKTNMYKANKQMHEKHTDQLPLP